MELTLNNLKDLIALAIKNNKIGLIQAMNANGYPIALNISDKDLYNSFLNVYNTKGLSSLKQVLDQVSFDVNKLTPSEKSAFYAEFPSNANARNFFTSVGNFLSGQTIVNTSGGGSSSTSLISPTTLIYFAGFGIIAIIFLALLSKNT